ncbi:MAG: hypothetical protein LBH62_08140 [Nitrososphaerota archaeon]|jgi:hypothetical protein|nr:hypothetical protein [Nitrososphaerota archaeon]
MNINVKSKSDLRYIDRKKTLAIVSLLFMITIISSPLISLYSSVSPFALGADPIEVGTESELADAINNAPDGESTVIIFTKNIVLEKTLEIPAGKNITLISKKSNSFYELYGVDGASTINVTKGAELVLAGVTVTHNAGAEGSGIVVDGLLTMTGGSIFNNNATDGSGVRNRGDFKLSGGSIYNNTAKQYGGGVYNDGNFTVTGGEISGNNARWGGGVYNNGKSFLMNGGDIYKNKASEGGGVYLKTFTSVIAGIIHDNTAERGGGVYISDNELKMTGGKIYKNVVSVDGGGVYNEGNFSMSGIAEIFNNTATDGYGGGVYTIGIYTVADGIIGNNTAINGGGVYVSASGNFTVNYAVIGNNTATGNGGGIGVPSLSILESVQVGSYTVFSNNKASSAYNRSSDHNDIYNRNINGNVKWTSPFTQGYNNYDIYYIWGNKTDIPTPSPSPSPTATAKPTSTVSPTKTASPTPTIKPDDGDGWFDWRIIVIIVLVIALVIAVLVFYLPKKNAKPAEEDLSDFTIV